MELDWMVLTGGAENGAANQQHIKLDSNPFFRFTNQHHQFQHSASHFAKPSFFGKTHLYPRDITDEAELLPALNGMLE
jgi:hypothetical protein